MDQLFQLFKTDVSTIKLPEKFTYPFNYIPHVLSEISANELQQYLYDQKEWSHNFGLDKTEKLGMGKMFGVLVCENSNGDVGQLWAFSGKLANGNQWSHFVPTVFDTLTQEGFYKKGETILNKYNAEIEKIKLDVAYVSSIEKYTYLVNKSSSELNLQKLKIKNLKKQREEKRLKASSTLEGEDLINFNNELNEESRRENIILKKMNKKWRATLKESKDKIVVFENRIKGLKQARKQKSAQLQQQLFEQYSFLNTLGETKSLRAIFNDNPPAGAGECCAPKLLHYAFSNNLKPLAMAEFWWGASPSSQIRKHKNFYPSCRSKCEPILLKHMLKGLVIDDNPLEASLDSEKKIEIIYDDKWITVVNKPSGLLSVPGKRIKNSVLTQVQQIFPEAEGPLLVHRLDRATSGLLIVAKDLESYINIQKQFTARTIKKRYIALIDGVIVSKSGEINLPLRVDLDNRPQQLVCYEYGKPSKTSYRIIKIKNNKTLIHFFPTTGRTHQLRVHSAHSKGLNKPIVGDDLYGKPNERLMLHAEFINFDHPKTTKNIEFELKSDFTI